MSWWLETFSASVPRAIGTLAWARAFHLPVWVVPLASFRAEVGFCETRAPLVATARTSLSSRLVMWLSRTRSCRAPMVRHVGDGALAELGQL